MIYVGLYVPVCFNKRKLYTFTLCCLFHSAGSVVVNYLLEMLKATPTETTSAVRETISTNNGVFAGYKVDASTVKASGTTTCLFDRFTLTLINQAII